MVSLPDFDPNDPGATPDDELFNRATLGVYEMGSVFKIFTTAMALDEHVATLDSSYDATNPIHIGRFTIHDDHPQRALAHRARDLRCIPRISAPRRWRSMSAPTAQRDFLGRLGLLQRAALRAARGRRAARARAPGAPVNTMTIAFGHGISVSPLQLATGVSAVVNGGILHPRDALKRRDERRRRRRARHVAKRPRTRCAGCCASSSSDGTGKLADAPGYLVGGKTGTAEKVAGTALRASTSCSRPSSASSRSTTRAIVVFVSIDEPHGNKQILRLRHRRLGRGARRSAASSSAWRRSWEFNRWTKIRPKFAVL